MYKNNHKVHKCTKITTKYTNVPKTSTTMKVHKYIKAKVHECKPMGGSLARRTGLYYENKYLNGVSLTI
jgi:hypothetical protein